MLRGKYGESLPREKRVRRAIRARGNYEKAFRRNRRNSGRGIRPTCPIAMEIWSVGAIKALSAVRFQLTLRKLVEWFYPRCLSSLKQGQIILSSAVSAKWSACTIECRHTIVRHRPIPSVERHVFPSGVENPRATRQIWKVFLKCIPIKYYFSSRAALIFSNVAVGLARCAEMFSY